MNTLQWMKFLEDNQELYKNRTKIDWNFEEEEIVPDTDSIRHATTDVKLGLFWAMMYSSMVTYVDRGGSDKPGYAKTTEAQLRDYLDLREEIPSWPPAGLF